MNAPRLMSMLAAAALLAGLTACGEQPQVISYEQGEYQGKADSQPWDNPVFKGDRAAWEGAIKQRARGQHEYNRIQ